MRKSVVVTARVDPETLDGLNRLAVHHDRSKAWLVNRAIGDFVRAETEFIAFLKEGENAIARGDYLTHDEMLDEVARWKHDRKRVA